MISGKILKSLSLIRNYSKIWFLNTNRETLSRLTNLTGMDFAVPKEITSTSIMLSKVKSILQRSLNYLEFCEEIFSLREP